ncbi:MAG: electron transfer flavoprotein subunit beta/FixA family protein [Acidimicrobiales bacterium]
MVCIKQVGALSDEVELADDGRDADADYLEHSLNEWDACAIEEALRITESQGGQGEVVAVTVGDEESEESLRRCLAMGAGRAKRVQPAEAAHDPLSIAAMLAEALAGESPDLVLCGVQSSDSVQAATGTMLAELVEMGRVAVVTKVDLDGATGNLRVHRELEGGLIDVVEVAMPALLTIQTGINEPRYATLRAIKQANLKEIEVLESASGKKPCYKVLRMFVPDRGAGAELLGTNAAEVARRVADIVAARLS